MFGEIFKLLLPILLQLLPQLFNKPKAKMVEWFASGAKAATSQKLPWNAFVMGAAQCAFEGMDDSQYEDVKFSIGAAADSVRATVAVQKAQQAAIGGGA
jgi:hypothetical protein